MNRTYGVLISLFLVCLFLLWRTLKRNKQEQTLMLAQLKRYPLIQQAWTAALAAKEPIVRLDGLASGMLASTYDNNQRTDCHQMTPQGLALSKEWLFVSMYCADHQHHSQIMVYDRTSGQLHKQVILPKRPHVGGLAYDSSEALLWVTITGQGNGRVGALSLAAILADDSAETGVPIHFQYSIDVVAIERASYLTCHHQELIAGSFSLKKVGHLAYYSLAKAKEEAVYGQKGQISPRRLFATTTKVQSIAIYQEWLFMVRSYGPRSSEVWVFPKDTERFSRKTVSLRIKCPPYLEQIVVEDDRLYCLFESGATAYRHKTSWPMEEVLVLAIPLLLHKKTGFKRNRQGNI
ncbi:hypothetical protein A5886_000778 [Enterococcus sp. 8G7_MSG3316]|uniref:Uncharacterized protein n=1 Tax=Candidatus Enterococcus testudinis TaxID=1834191 RepID=A0A242A422_9ENTE|nr:hypothetical protein [Enterococcus sp. 8G7_MSG3316]OTN75702.1 hypothetical protein A5886_000778 [Enterococcus sp. 8G7_MSG3316]